jgi:hypothetical protein
MVVVLRSPHKLTSIEISTKLGKFTMNSIAVQDSTCADIYRGKGERVLEVLLLNNEDMACGQTDEGSSLRCLRGYLIM